MAYWKCAACGFEAQNEKQKQEHTMKMANDPMHGKSPRPMGGQPWGGESTPGGGMKDSWKKPSEPTKAPMPAPRVDPKWGGKGEQKKP